MLNTLNFLSLRGARLKISSGCCDLRALRQHRSRNRHHSVTEITAWAQELFQKSLSVNTDHCVMHKWSLKLYHAKKEAICEHDPESLLSSLNQSSFKMD